MIWLTWRQHGQQALASAIGLGLVAAFFLVTHPGIANTFKSTGLASCLATPGRDCGQVAEQFDRQYRGLQFLVPLFLVVPLLVGLFWGAPLVARELEQGTHRLVWTQSVTRRRWFSTKLALIACAVVAGAAAFAELVTWWSGIFVRLHDNRSTPGIFDIRGIVPVAYALFALALGLRPRHRGIRRTRAKARGLPAASGGVDRGHGTSRGSRTSSSSFRRGCARGRSARPFAMRSGACTSRARSRRRSRYTWRTRSTSPGSACSVQLGGT
jgi:hypothetical protein